jgi:hypothetical protein
MQKLETQLAGRRYAKRKKKKKEKKKKKKNMYATSTHASFSLMQVQTRSNKLVITQCPYHAKRKPPGVEK